MYIFYFLIKLHYYSDSKTIKQSAVKFFFNNSALAETGTLAQTFIISSI